jgi:uncharacterized protein (TIGR02588 family)
MAAGSGLQERNYDSKVDSAATLGSDFQEQRELEAIPIWEWIVAAIGLVLVASVIGFLLYEALTGNQMPPHVKLSIGSVVQTSNGYLIQLTAVNQGGSTAKGVIIEGELRRGLEAVERSETTIDFLPSRSEKRAGLFFTQDPRAFKLHVRPFGYEEP